jgi:hypothetical protein
MKLFWKLLIISDQGPILVIFQNFQKCLLELFWGTLFILLYIHWNLHLEKYMEAPSATSKEDGLEINTEKS